MGTAEAIPRLITSERQVRMKYGFHRYLQDLSPADLAQYGRDAWRNFLTINYSGQLSPLPLDHRNHWYWRARSLHFFEEIDLRHGAYPNGMDDFQQDLKAPDPRSETVRAALSALDYRNLIDGKYLVKYGERKYITPLLQEGALQISPVSEFGRGSHNDAIRDLELSFTYHLYNPTDVLLNKYGASEFLTINASQGTLLLETVGEKDYYAVCFSGTYDPRLFDDFKADACLLIRDPAEFQTRLLFAAQASLTSLAKGCMYGRVNYVDPFSEPDPTILYPMRKHQRFMYQDEVRAAWQVNSGSVPLIPRIVPLGSLTDIAEAVYL